MAANACSNYISYKRLDPAKQEFRLLELQPSGSISDRVDCRLINVRLTDDLEFVALSSLYGDASETEIIIVNGRSLAIPKHVAQALRHVRAVFFPNVRRQQERRPVKKTPTWLRNLMNHVGSIFPSAEVEDQTPLRIWVDIVCVNQRNESETSRQVKNMRQIYGAAEIVIGWLGEKTENTDAGMGIMSEIEETMPPNWGDPGDKEKHPEDYAPTHAWIKRLSHNWQNGPNGEHYFTLPHWAGAYEFMSRPYFQRRWILEEIAHAKYPAFLVGDTIVPWKQILRLNRLMEEIRNSESDAFPSDMKYMIAEVPLETVYKLLDEFAQRRALDDAKILENTRSSHTAYSLTPSSLKSSDQG
ncbi:heterokaryon incompatibility protein [Seiridium cupressi]